MSPLTDQAWKVHGKTTSPLAGAKGTHIHNPRHGSFQNRDAIYLKTGR